MKREYTITGMTCDSCIEKVEQSLQGVPGIKDVRIQLSYPQATIDSGEPLNLEDLNSVLGKKGNYSIDDRRVEPELAPFPAIGKSKKGPDLPAKSLNTYQPLILIVAFIAGVSALAQYPDSFSWMLWMRHFMAGFFIVFSFFKLLNIKGFATSYAMYDLLAAKWKEWGTIYPFVELALGVAYLVNFNPIITNWATVAVLGFSSLGVIKSNLDKRKIKCACLGDVFNLPMSTVTIVEDLTMVGMAIVMLA